MDIHDIPMEFRATGVFGARTIFGGLSAGWPGTGTTSPNGNKRTAAGRVEPWLLAAGLIIDRCFGIWRNHPYDWLDSPFAG